MVVKSATKKKLMDLGIEEESAHKLADDRKWDDVKGLSPGQIAQICGIDSGTSQRIHDVMAWLWTALPARPISPFRGKFKS